MREPDARHEVARKRVVYHVPGTEAVRIAKAIPYVRGDAGRTFDAYYPPGAVAGWPAPAVLFVTGLSDSGAQKFLGCRINEMESFISWATLVAATGLVGLTYTTGEDAAADTRTAVAFLQAEGHRFGIDPRRVGIWACSAHVPNALGVLIDHPGLFRCAALNYGFMLDLDGATGVAEAQRTWRFANPAAGRPVEDLPSDTPLFVARAGRDTIPGVNDSIDRFLAHAIGRNLPLTSVNHQRAPHAFDLDDDSEGTRDVIRDLLAFLSRHLR